MGERGMIFNTKYMIKILKFLQITENMQKKLWIKRKRIIEMVFNTKYIVIISKFLQISLKKWNVRNRGEVSTSDCSGFQFLISYYKNFKVSSNDSEDAGGSRKGIVIRTINPFVSIFNTKYIAKIPKFLRIIEKNERGLRIVIRKNFKISSSNGGDAGGLKNSMERVFSRKKHWNWEKEKSKIEEGWNYSGRLVAFSRAEACSIIDCRDIFDHAASYSCYGNANRWGDSSGMKACRCLQRLRAFVHVKPP